MWWGGFEETLYVVAGVVFISGEAALGASPPNPLVRPSASDSRGPSTLRTPITPEELVRSLPWRAAKRKSKTKKTDSPKAVGSTRWIFQE